MAKGKDKRMSDMVGTGSYKIVKGYTLTFDWLMGVPSLPREVRSDSSILRSEKIIVRIELKFSDETC